MLKLKVQYFATWFQHHLIGKDSYAGKDWGQEEKGTTEDEMVVWHHQLNLCQFEQTLGDSEEQGSLAWCSPEGHKESDTTEWLNNNNYSDTQTRQRQYRKVQYKILHVHEHENLQNINKSNLAIYTNNAWWSNWIFQGLGDWFNIWESISVIYQAKI